MRAALLLRTTFWLIQSIVIHLAMAQNYLPGPPKFPQPILLPNASSSLSPGNNFNITWTPNTLFSNITLQLWDKTPWGYSRDFGTASCNRFGNPFCGIIVSHAPNTGSYLWSIPKPTSKFPRAQAVFYVKMYVEDFWRPDIGNDRPVISYSSNFSFAMENGGNDADAMAKSIDGSAAATMNNNAQTKATVVTVTVFEAPKPAPTDGRGSAIVSTLSTAVAA